MMIVHMFKTTEEAYDAVQTGKVKAGSIMMSLEEQVIGIADTWPISITVTHGQFHQLRDEVDPNELKILREMAENIKSAALLAQRLDWPLEQWVVKLH